MHPGEPPESGTSQRDDPLTSGCDSPAAQTLRRGLSILRLLARTHADGLRSSEIGRRLGLTKATAIRLTQALVDEGFIVHESDSARYRLGPEAFAVGLAAEPRYSIQRFAAPAVHTLAVTSGDWSCFSVREDLQAICVSVEAGDAPLPTGVLRVGDRYPLGIGSAGVAILSALPDMKVREVLTTLGEEIRRTYPGSNESSLLRQVREASQLGYALIPGSLLQGYWAMGVPVLNAEGDPIGALSLVAPEARMGHTRRTVLGERMRQLAQDVRRVAFQERPGR